jgi:hypothetical protein
MDRTQFENSAPFGRSEKISALKMNVPVLGDGDRHIEGDKRGTCPSGTSARYPLGSTPRAIRSYNRGIGLWTGPH